MKHLRNVINLTPFHRISLLCRGKHVYIHKVTVVYTRILFHYTRIRSLYDSNLNTKIRNTPIPKPPPPTLPTMPHSVPPVTTRCPSVLIDPSKSSIIAHHHPPPKTRPSLQVVPADLTRRAVTHANGPIHCAHSSATK